MHLGPFADLPALALEDDPPRLEHVGALAEVEGEKRVLLDQQDRDVLLVVQPAQELDELLDDERRQAERELVDRERARLGHQRSADRDHLLLAAGRAARGAVAELVELREEGVDPLESLARLVRGDGGSGSSTSRSPSGTSGRTRRAADSPRPGGSGTPADPRAPASDRGGRPGSASSRSRRRPPPEPCLPRGRTTPQTALRRDDLPAPFAPTSATRSPAPSVSETPSSATAGP